MKIIDILQCNIKLVIIDVWTVDTGQRFPLHLQHNCEREDIFYYWDMEEILHFFLYISSIIIVLLRIKVCNQ